MQKKYIVRLTDEERKSLREVIGKLKGSSQKVRRAQILLKADADGPNWTDRKIAEAFSCRTQTVESLRQRLVTEGFDAALCGKKSVKPPREKRLDGEQEAKVIALRLGEPPPGYHLLSEGRGEHRVCRSPRRVCIGKGTVHPVCHVSICAAIALVTSSKQPGASDATSTWYRSFP